MWAVDFRVEGRRLRRRLFIRDKAMKRLAIKKAKALHSEVWERNLRPIDPAQTMPFDQAAELYIGQGGETRFLTKIREYFGSDIRVDAIDELTIAQASEALYPHAKPDTVRRQLRVPIRAVQNFAAGKRRRSSTDTARTRWLTPEEAERLLRVAADPSAAGLRDPERHTLRKIAFMLGTGAGPGETMSLTVEGWNPATKEWWLPGTKTAYRQRFVLLPTRTIELIGLLPESGRAFRAPNGAEYTLRENGGGQMAEAFRKVREGAGLSSEVVPYTLRHTWATWSYSQTRDWGGLLDQGGWNRSETANRYRKIAPADLGHRLLAHGWDFRRNPGPPVRFGELVSVRFS